MMGTIVIDERIYPIRSFALGEGAILAVVSMSAPEVARIPDGFGWSLHAPDGSFVCRGRLPFPPFVPFYTDDSVELTLRLEIEGKIATPVESRA